MKLPKGVTVCWNKRVFKNEIPEEIAKTMPKKMKESLEKKTGKPKQTKNDK